MILTEKELCALLMPECMAPGHDETFCWLPLETESRWRVYQVHLQQLENNILYRMALDELQFNVLYDVAEQEGSV